MENYLIAESLIIERLRDQISNISVVSISELATVTTRSQLIPAIQVIYSGDKIEAEGGQVSGHIFARQKWLVVLVVRDNRSITDGTTVDVAGGEYLMQIIVALSGYQLSSDHGFLRRESSPTTQYKNGFAYFPLMFSTKIETTGSLI